MLGCCLWVSCFFWCDILFCRGEASIDSGVRFFVDVVPKCVDYKFDRCSSRRQIVRFVLVVEDGRRPDFVPTSMSYSALRSVSATDPEDFMVHTVTDD